MNETKLLCQKSQLNIQQYSIKQGSIEQIFNHFAAEEEEHHAAENERAHPLPDLASSQRQP